jgi:negative regulator of flagellin synthesis FlgM
MSIQQVNGQERLRATMALAALRTNSTSTAPTTAAATRRPDAVSISDAARALGSNRTAVTSAGEVREDRIRALKAAIADGTYTVTSRTLANSMIKKAESLGS